MQVQASRKWKMENRIGKIGTAVPISNPISNTAGCPQLVWILAIFRVWFCQNYVIKNLEKLSNGFDKK